MTADWTRTEVLPGLTAYTWRGWVIDQWECGVNVLWTDDRPVMQFGTVEELQARALELEAIHDR